MEIDFNNLDLVSTADLKAVMDTLLEAQESEENFGLVAAIEEELEWRELEPKDSEADHPLQS